MDLSTDEQQKIKSLCILAAQLSDPNQIMRDEKSGVLLNIILI